MAEFIIPQVVVGQYVKCGQSIALFTRDHTSGVGIETGWVRPGTNEPCSTDTSGNPTPGGENFTRWLNKLGCPTRAALSGPVPQCVPACRWAHR